MKHLRPFLRWAGSKRRLLPRLLPYWGRGFDRYVEPFAGSASLYFAIQPTRALLGDTNAELIGAYKEIQLHPRSVFNRLVKIPRGHDSYYDVRRIVPATLDRKGQAARFLFLNRYCFNGLYRTNQKGAFNVPFARSGTGDPLGWSEFRAAASVLSGARLVVADFQTMLEANVRRGDFVYLDPPYALANRRVFRQYGPDTFGLEDLERLQECLKVIASRKAHFLLSYAYCREALRTFKGWQTRKLFTQRNIAGFAEDRRMAAEVLVSNFVPSDEASNDGEGV